MLKKLVLIIIASLTCYIASAQNTNAVDMPDDDVVLSPDIDSVLEAHPVTGKMRYIKTFGRLQLVSYHSGKQIFKGEEASEPVAKAAQESIESFFKELYAEELVKTKDYYDYIMILIDADGKVDLLNTNFYTNKTEEIDILRKGMWEKTKDLTFVPAKKDGKPVPYLVSLLAPEKNYKK